jgi:hypothetical protein
LVRTVVLTDPDATPNRPATVETDKVGPGACVTVNVAEAAPADKTTVPVRAADPGFTPAVAVNTAPLAPPARLASNHAADDWTDHDDWLVVTKVDAMPPCPRIEADAGESATQGGAVTDTVYSTGAGYAEAALRTTR